MTEGTRAPGVGARDVGELPPPEELLDGIWRLRIPLPGHFLSSVNCYLLHDREGYVLVDCGYDVTESRAAMQAHLDHLGVPLAGIHTILVTHGHADHVGASAPLSAATGAGVALHGADRELIAFRYGRAEWARERNVAWLLRLGFPPDDLPMGGQPSRGREVELTLPSAARELAAGEHLVVGAYRLEVLWTPGHTPGHICLYERSHGLLLCGDHVLEKVTPHVGLIPYTDANHLPAYLASLRHLAALDVRLALPGHGAPMARFAERALQLLAKHEERQARLVALLTSRPQTAYALAGQEWADATPTSWDRFSDFLRRNAVSLLAGHLGALVEQGRASTADEDGRAVFWREA